LQERIFVLDWVARFAASARPPTPGELAVDNERGSETLAFTRVERVSIIGIELLNLDVVVGRKLWSGARFGSSNRTKGGHRSQQNGWKKAALHHE
jgi:hypothetical protein